MHQAAVEHFSSEDGWDIGHQRTLVSRTVYLIKIHKILFNFIRGNSGSKSCHPHIILSCNFSNSAFGKSFLSSYDLRTRWTQRSSICSWIYGLPWPWTSLLAGCYADVTPLHPWDVKRRTDILEPGARTTQCAKGKLGACFGLALSGTFIFLLDWSIYLHSFISLPIYILLVYIFTMVRGPSKP